MPHRDKVDISNTADANRCIRDLVALSALPAIWLGSDDLRQIAQGVADALFGMLRPNILYVGLNDPRTGERAIEVARTHEDWQTEARAQALGRTFAPWLNTRDAGVVRSIHNPLEPGMARLLTTPIGHNGTIGFIATVSHLINFPDEVERLLLNVGANQAAVAIQNAQLLKAKRKIEAHKKAASRLHGRLWRLLQEGSGENSIVLTPERLIELLSAKEERGHQVARLLGKLYKVSQRHYARHEREAADDTPHPPSKGRRN